jgi:hypothetical protein
MHAKTIAYQLQLCAYVLDKNIQDVSHEESLTSVENGGSCLNWVLGHVIRTRDLALASMGQTPLFPIEEFNAYDDRGGSQFGPETALPFDELKRRFQATQERLLGVINNMSSEAMAARPQRSLTGDPNETVGSNLATFVFHESYHVGQTGVLRRVSGKPGVIKPPAV